MSKIKHLQFPNKTVSQTTFSKVNSDLQLTFRCISHTIKASGLYLCLDIFAILHWYLSFQQQAYYEVLTKPNVLRKVLACAKVGTLSFDKRFWIYFCILPFLILSFPLISMEQSLTASFRNRFEIRNPDL